MTSRNNFKNISNPSWNGEVVKITNKKMIEHFRSKVNNGLLCKNDVPKEFREFM